MGTGLAFKPARFEAVAVEVRRASDGLGRPPRAPRPAWLAGLLADAVSRLRKARDALLARRPAEEDDWAFSRSRFNALVLAKLRERTTGGVFVAGSYHMPCAYKRPGAMTLHAAVAAQCALAFAGAAPLALAGDWNVKPGSPQYALLSGGALGAGDPALPAAPPGERFSPALAQPLRSAHAVVHGAEPDFTNWAQGEGWGGGGQPCKFVCASSGPGVCDLTRGCRRSAGRAGVLRNAGLRVGHLPLAVPRGGRLRRRGGARLPRPTPDPTFCGSVCYCRSRAPARPPPPRRAQLPSRTQIEGPLPGDSEPSDHIMIAATLRF